MSAKLLEGAPIADQIKADRYLASKDAAKAKGLGIRVGRMIPPGAC